MWTGKPFTALIPASYVDQNNLVSSQQIRVLFIKVPWTAGQSLFLQCLVSTKVSICFFTSAVPRHCLRIWGSSVSLQLQFICLTCCSKIDLCMKINRVHSCNWCLASATDEEIYFKKFIHKRVWLVIILIIKFSLCSFCIFISDSASN